MDACDLHGDDCEPIRHIRSYIDEKHDALRRDVSEKHQQNRRDIHEVRNKLQENTDDLHELAGRIRPYLDNGQPGLFTRMSDKLDSMLVQLSEMRGEGKYRRWLAQLVGPLIVGILLLIGQHFWK